MTGSLVFLISGNRNNITRAKAVMLEPTKVITCPNQIIKNSRISRIMVIATVSMVYSENYARYLYNTVISELSANA